MTVNALSRVEVRQWSSLKNIFIYCACPGYCSTDLNQHGPGSRSPELGADSILYVVNSPHSQLKNRQFYQDEKLLPQIYIDQEKIDKIMELLKTANGQKWFHLHYVISYFIKERFLLKFSVFHKYFSSINKNFVRVCILTLS